MDSQPTSATVESNLQYAFSHKREVNRLKTSSLKQTLKANNHKTTFFISDIRRPDNR